MSNRLTMEQFDSEIEVVRRKADIDPFQSF